MSYELFSSHACNQGQRILTFWLWFVTMIIILNAVPGKICRYMKQCPSLVHKRINDFVHGSFDQVNSDITRQGCRKKNLTQLYTGTI